MVFFAVTDDNDGPDVMKYDTGVVSVVVALGETTPIGGQYESFCTEAIGWSDGTLIPTGTIPDINEAGDICFYAWVDGGVSDLGVFVVDDGVTTCWLRADQVTPACGGAPDACAGAFGCRVFDFDADSDVDLADFAGFQAAFEG